MNDERQAKLLEAYLAALRQNAEFRLLFDKWRLFLFRRVLIPTRLRWEGHAHRVLYWKAGVGRLCRTEPRSRSGTKSP